MEDEADYLEPIAVIAFAGSFPGASNTKKLWNLLKNGRCSIDRFTRQEMENTGVPQRLFDDPDHIPYCAPLEHAEHFDAKFFGYSPREAAWLDPQQRLFLEKSHEALERAAHTPENFEGLIGLFASASAPTYLQSLLAASRLPLDFDPYSLIAKGADLLAPRVAYHLNLNGPVFMVQSACSGSLVSIHVASQSLLNGECDMAIAGGVSLSFPQRAGHLHRQGGVGSKDGRCRPFEAHSSGTVSGEAVAIIVLRRLEDALRDGDPIRAIIRGSSVNNDGARKVGFSAPSVLAQVEVIEQALAIAGCEPSSIQHVEAHGTGTALGDSIEAAALRRVFAGASGRCSVGSIKGNIGHTDAAAGACSLIKVILCIESARRVPLVDFKTLNSNVDFNNTSLFICAEEAPWPAPPDHPRRAAISAWGLGGTNAHLIVEEAPKPPKRSPSSAPQLILISAKTPRALEQATSQLEAHLQAQNPHLDAVAWTTQHARTPHPLRRALVANNSKNASRLLRERSLKIISGETPTIPSKVVFLFPGVGDHYKGMGLNLLKTSHAFAEALQRCEEYLQRIEGISFPTFSNHPPKSSPQSSQPGNMRRWLSALNPKAPTTPIPPSTLHPWIFSVEYALAHHWIALGIVPVAMLGESLGEYVAATIAGVFSLEDALSLVTTRAHLIESLPPSAMSVVAAPAKTLTLENSGVSVAAMMGPSQTLLGGPSKSLDALEDLWTTQELPWRRLPVDRAVHIPSTKVIAPALRAALENIPKHPPHLPWISNLNGTWITPSEATSPDYWVRHLCEPLQLFEGLSVIAKHNATASTPPLNTPAWIPLEVGPGRHLVTLLAEAQRSVTEEQKRDPKIHIGCTSLPAAHQNSDEGQHALETLGHLWIQGTEITWGTLHRAPNTPLPPRLELPTYPFERLLCRPPSPAAHRRTQTEEKRRIHSQNEEKAEQHFAENPAENSSMGPDPRSIEGQRSTKRATGALQVMMEAWIQLFGVKTISQHADFFEMGGHSLLAIQLLYKLRKEHHIDLSVQHIIEHPTLEGLAKIAQTQNPEAFAQALSSRWVLRQASRQKEGELGSREASSDSLETLRTGWRLTPRIWSAAHPAMRPGLLLRHLENVFPKEHMNLSARLPDVIMICKRDLGCVVYPHEVIAHPKSEDFALNLAKDFSRREVKDVNQPSPLEHHLSLELLLGEEIEGGEIEDWKGEVPTRGGGVEGPVFVLSSARSGSTLLRVMLGGHPKLFCPPEMHLLMFPTLAERAAAIPSEHFGKGLNIALSELLGRSAGEGAFSEMLEGDLSIEEVYRRLESFSEGLILVDKSPSYAEHLETLERAKNLFPGARYIFLTRHPASVMSSLVHNRMDRIDSFEMKDPWLQAERHWVKHYGNISRFLSGVDPKQVHQLSFEVLVQTPETRGRALCVFLGLEWDPAILKPYSGRRMRAGAGDPNFHEHDQIEANKASEWRRARLPYMLTKATQRLAARLGYTSAKNEKTPEVSPRDPRP